MIDTCYVGDVRDGLRAFVAAGIRARTCVTSPPYFGLRDYGTAQWEGGDAACDHKKPSADVGNIAHSTLGGGLATNAAQVGGYRTECGKCGARRIDRQLGLEPTIAEYVANMVEVFRLVRDVLTDDGTIWVNLGDSYNAGTAAPSRPSKSADVGGWTTRSGDAAGARRVDAAGLKPKDLCGIPWRVAFALQADGWYLRSDVIWHKPNPMPESVTDRPTKAHEYLFLLAKSERYFYDAEAIKEPASDNTHARRAIRPRGWASDGLHSAAAHSAAGQPRPAGVNPKAAPAGSGIKQNESFSAAVADVVSDRNKRSVWTVASEPFPEAHFATFPTALVEPCVLAGSAPGDVVLDPFLGSGTVAQVAQSLGRRWIGCELSREYHKMILRRTAQFGMELSA